MKGAFEAIGRAKGEHGSFLVFSAMLSLVVVAMVGLLYFLTSATTVQQGTNGVAKLAALAAVQEYARFACTNYNDVAGCNTEKLAAAKARVNEILLGSQPNQTRFAGVSINIGGPLNENTVVITPGRYYTSQRANQDPCSGSYPCFLPTVENEYANSMRVEGKVQNSFTNSAKAFFNFGDSHFESKFSVTVTTVPMRGCFLVDLSTSIAEDTHLHSTGDPGQDPKPSFFSFHYDEPSSGGTVNGPKPASIWGDLEPDRDSASGAFPNSRHFQDDYATVSSFSRDELTWSSYARNRFHPRPGEDPFVLNPPSAAPQYYKLDMYRNGGYSGAQPWFDIMTGLNATVDLFRKRQLPGDRVCLAFFDDTLSWNRLVVLTDNFDYVNGPDGVIDLAKIKSGNDPEALWIKLRLFPRDDTFTDVLSAMSWAVNQFDEKTDIPAKDFLAMFSDGLANCVRPDGVGNATSWNPNCQDSYSYHREVMARVRNLAEKSLVPKKVMLHMFLVGDQVRPHTLNLANPDGSCMTDEQARTYRQTSPSFVDGKMLVTAWNGPGAEPPDYDLFTWGQAYQNKFISPLLLPNAEWYKIVRMTGGRWLPLRKSLYSEENCPAVSCSGAAAGSIQDTDPKCRSVADQVKDGMEAIFNDSQAFTIVSTSGL